MAASVEIVGGTNYGSGIQPSTSPNISGSGEQEQNQTTLSGILGLQDFYSLQVWRASLAEVIGTASLVFTMDTISISSSQTIAPNLIMSLLIASIVTILLFATVPVSGGHLNPIVTLTATFAGLVSLSRAAIYVSAQCLGGILGALALKAVVNRTIQHSVSLGGCTLNVLAPGPNGPITVGIDMAQALWMEIICTFLFLFSSIGLAFDKRQAKSLGGVVVCSTVGLVVGLIVFISTTVTMTEGYSGVGMNPARCLGPAMVRGGHLWNGHWVFWVGPFISSVAFAVYTKIIPKASS